MPEPPLIVCVDDDPDVREALRELLVAYGYTARTYSSAEDLLGAGALPRIDCLITDLNLRGMSGLQLHDRLTAAGYRVPTIILSASADEYTRATADRTGAVGVLLKPIRTEQLLVQLQKALLSRTDDCRI